MVNVPGFGGKSGNLASLEAEYTMALKILKDKHKTSRARVKVSFANPIDELTRRGTDQPLVQAAVDSVRRFHDAGRLDVDRFYAWVGEELEKQKKFAIQGQQIV